jgi:hypothetical protein
MCGYFPYGHCVVIGGVRGDGTPDGTTLTIYDPDGGRVYPVFYSKAMRMYPYATSWLLHR